MQHLNITFPETLRKKLDSQAKREGTKRSSLIQKAVLIYLQLQERKSLHRLLAEAYQEIAPEDRQLLKDFEELDRESLRYLD